MAPARINGNECFRKTRQLRMIPGRIMGLLATAGRVMDVFPPNLLIAAYRLGLAHSDLQIDSHQAAWCYGCQPPSKCLQTPSNRRFGRTGMILSPNCTHQAPSQRAVPSHTADPIQTYDASLMASHATFLTSANQHYWLR